MPKFRDLKTLTKVLTLVGLLAVVSVGATVFVTAKMKYIDDTYGDLLDGPGRANLAIARANRNLVYVNRSIYRLLVETTDEGRQAAVKEITDSKGFYDNQINAAIKGLPAQAREIRTVADDFSAALSTACAETISLGRSGTPDDRQAAATKMHQACDPALLQAMEKISILTNKILKADDVASDEAGAVTADAIKYTYILMLGGLAIVLGITVASTRRTISLPIGTIVRALNKLAVGDFDAEIVGADRRDEVGDIARAALVFRDQGRETVQLRAEQQAQQTRAEEEKRASLLRMAETVELEAGASVDQIAVLTVRMSETATSMAQSAAAVGENSQSVAAAATQALANAQTVASAAEELSASIREIGSQVSVATQVTSKAVGASNRAQTTIALLSKAVGRIGEVASLINGIASQTNLLALNATIEAARAGEAGKGFAVVANEVKSLANQTARATDEITAQIAEIQATTNEAVNSVGEIGSAITEVQHVSSSIASAIEEQGAATQEIARNIGQTTEAAQEVAEHIGRVAAEARSTGERAGLVGAISADVASGIGRLQEVLVRTVRSSTDEVNRRASPRIEVNRSATLFVGGKDHPIMIQNLSEGGFSASGVSAGMVHGAAIEISISGISQRLTATVLSGEDGWVRGRFTLTTNDEARWKREWTSLQGQMMPLPTAA